MLFVEIKERTCTINEDYLCKLLAETLPLQLQVQKTIYKNKKEFFHDLEMFGKLYYIRVRAHDYCVT